MNNKQNLDKDDNNGNKIFDLSKYAEQLGFPKGFYDEHMKEESVVTTKFYEKLLECETMLYNLYNKSNFCAHTIELSQNVKNPINGEDLEEEFKVLFGDKDDK